MMIVHGQCFSKHSKHTFTGKGRWNVSSGDNEMVPGKGHSNQVQDMEATADTLVTVGMDDMIMFSKLATIGQSGLLTIF